MKEKKTKSRKYFAPQNEGKFHPCDFPGCDKKGEYRAPKDKTLKEYYWFCLDHVTEYNAKWNYYEDESAQADLKTNQKIHFGGFSSKIKYQFGYDFIDELGDILQFDAQNWRQKVYFNKHDQECAEILNISLDDIDLNKLKKQYKKLARKYHPDMNAGSKASEEKFKQITTAYNDLAKKIKN